MIIDQRMARLADHMRKAVLRGEFRGPIGHLLARDGQRATPSGDGYRGAYHVDDGLTGTRIVLSLDAGMHTSGWFKNPDYERCLHLSLSMIDPVSGDYLPQQHSLAAMWVTAFFGEHRRLVWVESPKTPEGIAKGVYHYRLFLDEHRQPIKPRGEVYSRQSTETDWKTWSEVHSEIAQSRMKPGGGATPMPRMLPTR